ncbi:MAG: Rrf2 family transcriptional regulator [Planctomycetota bacterium]|nr:MAG: Rrf2 family transcriptional regulator [Planctomycetota bacterium]
MLSQTCEYALRAMVWLAYTEDGLMPTSSLAERTGVPFNYLAKVLQSLAQADLIVGRRGVGGGYRLARPAEEITMLDVINAINPVERITSCPLGLPSHGPNLCMLHRQLDQAAKALIDTFQGVTLADLLDDRERSRPLCDTEMLRELGLKFEGRSIKPK